MNSSKFSTRLTVLVTTVVTIMLVTTLLPASSVNANASSAPALVTAPAAIYGDSLASGWQDWSWNSSRNLSNSSPVQSGSRSTSVQITGAWGAFYLHNAGVSTSGYSSLEFYINGGASGGQRLKVIANGNTTCELLGHAGREQLDQGFDSPVQPWLAQCPERSILPGCSRQITACLLPRLDRAGRLWRDKPDSGAHPTPGAADRDPAGDSPGPANCDPADSAPGPADCDPALKRPPHLLRILARHRLFTVTAWHPAGRIGRGAPHAI